MISEKKFDEFWHKDRGSYNDLVRVLERLKEDLKNDLVENDSEPITETQITISVNKDCTTWSYQSGDNSYTGSCYGDPYWGVNWVSIYSDLLWLADSLISDLAEQVFGDPVNTVEA